MNLPLDWDVFGTQEVLRQSRLLMRLKELSMFHEKHCDAYARIVSGVDFNRCQTLADLPWVSARLFKHFELNSVSAESIKRILQSSGTSGAKPARIVLDMQTSALQTRVLAKTLETVLGKKRLPLALIDTSPASSDSKFTARQAGNMGLSLFGSSVLYLQEGSSNWNQGALQHFYDTYKHSPVIFFGFTFMVWQLLEYLEEKGMRFHFDKGILLHSGGWKKLEHRAVDRETFKNKCMHILGLEQVYNFYGMAEQTGSIFMECSHGYLHCSAYNHVIVRNPITFQPEGIGRTGLIQVISALPESYPGHSILTEDLGCLNGLEGCLCGRAGPYFTVHGRVPGVEVRGCSNV